MPNDLLIEPVVRAALLEDLARGGDITTDSILSEDQPATGYIVVRQPGILAGHGAARIAFGLLDPASQYDVLIKEGAPVSPPARAARISGRARAIVAGERTALNFLCHLSGIATATRLLVDAIAAFPARIACTRKTTPGMRLVERAAVMAGGGSMHRFGLDDGVLIKDNHIALAGGVAPAIFAVRKRIGHMVKVEVEVDTLAQLHEAIALPIDAVLLDNMPLEILAQAVEIVGGRVLTEASGAITAENIVPVAATGVDLISVGWITHSAPALDLGLDIEPAE